MQAFTFLPLVASALLTAASAAPARDPVAMFAEYCFDANRLDGHAKRPEAGSR